MQVNIRGFSTDVQALLELRDNIQVTIDALGLCNDKAAKDLVAPFEEYRADLNELIEKLTRGTAEPAEAAPDAALEHLLASLRIEVLQPSSNSLPGGGTFPLPADFPGRGPKRS